MSDTDMAEAESTPMSETPHGTNANSRASHNSYESNADSGYLTLTPRSGGFTPSIGGACRSRGTHASTKRPYYLRADSRQSKLRSKFNSLINASDRAYDTSIDQSREISFAGISHDSGNFSCERAASRSETSPEFRGAQQAEVRDVAAELRERRSRSRRAWRSAAPITPASRLQILSPPPSPAVPSASFVASEPIDEDVEMKLVVAPQSTPYIENSPNSMSRRVSARYFLNFSPKAGALRAKNCPSVDNKRLGKLAISDLTRVVADIKPKRLDFSQRALSHSLQKNRRATPDFTGKSIVDIVTLLGEKSNHWRVVSKILGNLTPQDLCSFSMVSKAWRRICINDSKANTRRLGHIIIRQNTKENLKLVRKAKLEANVTTSPRSRYARKGYLLEVQNFLQPPAAQRPPNSPPVSPSKVKFHSFVKASRTLEPWEHLLPCPNCSFPCHVDDERNVGKCSRQGCSMEFCTSCSSRPHAGPCKTPLLATPTKRNKRLIVGSRQSKRNLRRL